MSTALGKLAQVGDRLVIRQSGPELVLDEDPRHAAAIFKAPHVRTLAAFRLLSPKSKIRQARVQLSEYHHETVVS